MQCNHQIKLKSGIEVPCGKCPACLANLRQEWVFRLQQEQKVSEFSIFVTLTYDEDHVPAGMSVCKRDVVLFHKRLRKHFPSNDLRYYVISEYGDHTFRPHYHGLYFFKTKYDIDRIYQIFFESWQNGFIKFGEVELASIVYCTKYCLKYKDIPLGRKPNFRLVSKMNGGIGISYLAKMKDYHLETKNFISVYENGKRTRMPRYYKDIMHPTSGCSKYNPLHWRFERDIDYAKESEFWKDYAKYCTRQGLCKDEAKSIASFIEFRDKANQRRDDLLVKHTQKQKM